MNMIDKVQGFHRGGESITVMPDSQPTIVKSLDKEQIPADVDIIEIVKWLQHYLIHAPDPNYDYECMHCMGPLGYPIGIPIVSVPGHRDIIAVDHDAGMERSLMYVREILKNGIENEIEKAMRRRTRKLLHDDGWVWLPETVWTIIPSEEEWPHQWVTAIAMQNLARQWYETGDKTFLEQAAKIFKALKSAASWDTGRAYYPHGFVPVKPDGKVMLTHGWGSSMIGQYPVVLHDLLEYYAFTKDEEALDFAIALGEGILAELQPNQGQIRISSKDGSYQGHLHHHLYFLIGMAHLGLTTRDPRIIEWTRRAYEFTYGISLDTGWFWEFTPSGPDVAIASEGCNTGDMMATAVYLAKSGYTNYWDDVERIVRNQLIESQFFVTSEFESLYRKLHANNPKEIKAGLSELKDLEGAIIGRATPNDWVTGDPATLGQPGIFANGINMMGCCTLQCTLGLYTLWKHMVEEKQDSVYVYTSLKYENSAVKVISFLPKQGRITIIAGKDADYFFRVPAWVARGTVKTYRNINEVSPDWHKEYIRFQLAKKDEELTITYPLIKFEQQVILGGRPASYEQWLNKSNEVSLKLDERDRVWIKSSSKYILRWLGNTCFDVSPKSKYLPMYVHRSNKVL